MRKSSILIVSTAIFLMMALSAFLIWKLYAVQPGQTTREPVVVVEQELVEPEAEVEAEVEGLDSLDGPFVVKNSETGKNNTLGRKDGSLILSDEAGKVLWSIPFDTPLCGRVCNIDFFHNGKIQFLFISGSRLFLMDRLGRVVDKCNAVLPKEVLLGPDLYDFNKNGKYHIIVLNSDNTIDMYDLQGKKPEKWLGISPEAKILSLPRYELRDGKSFWTIPTTDGDKVYSFYGGEPVR